MKKAVIFDCDGTLIHSFPLILDALDKACKKYRYYNLSDEEYARIYGPNELGCIAKLVVPEDVKDAFYEYLKVYEQEHDKFIHGFIDGIEDILVDLNKRKDINVYLLTGRSVETTMITLLKLDALKYFKDAYYGSPEGPIKARLLEQLSKEHGLKFDELLYIGDSTEDIKQCRKVNVDIISVSYDRPESYDKLNELNPGNVAKDSSELLSKINEFLK